MHALMYSYMIYSKKSIFFALTIWTSNPGTLILKISADDVDSGEFWNIILM